MLLTALFIHQVQVNCDTSVVVQVHVCFKFYIQKNYCNDIVIMILWLLLGAGDRGHRGCH